MDKVFVVGMGDLVVTSQPTSVLTVLGLGSCIGVCAYDPISKVGGLAHLVLPRTMNANSKFLAESVDVGIPNLLNAMTAAGARKSRIRIALVGGAQVFKQQVFDVIMDVGIRNIEASKSILQSLGITPSCCDVGGSVGRTARLYLDSGTVTVRRIGAQESVLADLSAL